MPARLVILDEPTSSLDAVVAGQLLAFVRRFVAGGGGCVLISHLLGEILDRVRPGRGDARRPGRGVAARPASSPATRWWPRWATSPRRAQEQVGDGGDGGPRPSWPAAHPGRGGPGAGWPIAGEIVGLAGLAGQGQSELLRRMFDAARRRTPGRGDRRQRRARGRRPADRRHLPALVDRREHQHRLPAGADPAGPGRRRCGGRARRAAGGSGSASARPTWTTTS